MDTKVEKMKRNRFFLGIVFCIFFGYTSTAKAEGQTAAPVFTAVVNPGFGPGNINCVAYGNGRFIAGGNGGKISYSSDGITWTPVTGNTLSSMQINGIAYGNNRFVAVGEGGEIAYSSDGTAWTLIPESPFTETGGITYGNGKFVVGGSAMWVEGVWEEEGGAMIAYSADGITWNRVTDLPFPLGFGRISAVAYNGNGEYFAISYNGMGVESAGAYSSDGITWTTNLYGPYSEKHAIAYGSGKYVFGIAEILGTRVGADGDIVSNNIFGDSYIFCAAYGNGIFISGGDDGKMAYSADGFTWSLLANNGFGTTQINGIAFGNGKFVAVGNEGKIVYSK
jgi:hypothetical protein